MSDSENEYEVMWERNLKRKQALLALLGIDNLIDERRKLVQKQEEQKVRKPVRRRSTADTLPARRSERISKQSCKVKYVRGFRGFDSDSNANELLNSCENFDDKSYKHSVEISTKKCSNEDVENNEHVPWHKRSEETCLSVIQNMFQRSDTFEDLHSDDDSDDWSKYENVHFFLSTDDSGDSDVSTESNNTNHRRRRVSHSKRSGVPELSCGDVTEDIISNIAKRSSCKVYDQVNGTTCHQCRQKTFDTKTFCRSGRCIGVRGMFCGICLPKRYGEQVVDALKNPSWECPVCRGICNCSFCRARAGKIPTGILYPEALQNGYNCVAEYLKDRDEEKKKEKKRKVIVTDQNY